MFMWKIYYLYMYYLNAANVVVSASYHKCVILLQLKTAFNMCISRYMNSECSQNLELET